MVFQWSNLSIAEETRKAIDFQRLNSQMFDCRVAPSIIIGTAKSGVDQIRNKSTNSFPRVLQDGVMENSSFFRGYHHFCIKSHEIRSKLRCFSMFFLMFSFFTPRFFHVFFQDLRATFQPGGSGGAGFGIGATLATPALGGLEMFFLLISTGFQ